MSRKDAAQTEEKNTPMLKWLVLPMVVLAYIAVTASAGVPRDRDHDRLPDSWERKHHLSTTKASARRDPDHDRLSNRRELRLRTHPQRADTDGDGFSDRTELRKGTNPRKRRSHPRRRGSKSPRRPASPAPSRFPNPASTGVPAGWRPAQTRTSDLEVNRAGAVVQDIRMTNGADILVQAPNVTIRRVNLQGGVIMNQVNSCATGLRVEDTTIEPSPGQPYTPDAGAVIGEGGYTARRIEIWKRGEGFRASDCGRIRVEDSFTYILGDTADCGRDLHSDGAQAFHARGSTFVNNTIIFGNDCGTSPYFMGHGSKNPNIPTINTGVYNVDRLLVSGGGYVFRQQVPGSVTGLRIVNRSWVYGPIDNRCSVISPWEAKIVNVDSSYRVTGVVRRQPCNTEVVE